MFLLLPLAGYRRNILDGHRQVRVDGAVADQLKSELPLDLLDAVLFLMTLVSLCKLVDCWARHFERRVRSRVCSGGGFFPAGRQADRDGEGNGGREKTQGE